jgi:hypothetical protein
VGRDDRPRVCPNVSYPPLAGIWWNEL